MRIRTVLNHCYKFKSFVYKSERWEEYGGKRCIVVGIEPRKNGHHVCSGCQQTGRVYDHLPQPRYFEFVPLWGIAVYFCYVMCRVNCRRCGVTVESVPWCDGKNQLTKAYQIFLAQWARRLSWKEVADVFQTSWNSVFRSVCTVVEFGLKHRDLTGIEAIGVDELHHQHGQKYITLVYQLDQGKKRLLYVAKNRTLKSFLGFFRLIGKEASSKLKFVCSDMWPAYLTVIKKKAPQALNILDRFHIVKKLNDAVNDIRIAEVKSLAKDGYEPILKNSKYCFLKRKENLTEKQKIKLNDILQYDLKIVRAHLLKESFQAFWEYSSPYWAEQYLKLWCTRAMRSKLDPMKKFVKTIRKHQALIMNWFKAKKAYSSGAVEGLNRKVNLVTRKAYGYKSYDVLKIALFHTMGALPEPEMTHRFC